MFALDKVATKCLGVLARAESCVHCDGHRFKVEAIEAGTGYAIWRTCLSCGDSIHMKGVRV